MPDEAHAYRIIRSRRRTLALVVTQDGELHVRAPLQATREQIQEVIVKHDDWIRRKKAEQALRRPPAMTFTEGERLPVDGRLLRLCFGATGRSAVLLQKDSLLVSKRLEGHAQKIEAALILFYKKATLERMQRRVRQLCQKTGLHVNRIGVTRATRRWGSCSSRGNLNFSYRLAMAPEFVQEYLAVHEVAHLKHPNHSPAFWAQVAEWMSEFRPAEEWLKNEGPKLPL